MKIEGVLSAPCDVAESAVFGVPHRVLGQEVKAVVRVAHGRTLEEGTLRQWLDAELSAFKVPTHFEWVTEPLPGNPGGKVLKHVLADRAQSIFADDAAPS